MTPNDLPPHTSASQLVAYALCPRKYACRYLYDLPPEFRSTSLILGSAVHGSIGWFFEEVRQGNRPTLKDAERVLEADLVALTSEVPVRWKTTTPASLEDEARRLVTLYLGTYADLPVVAVEQPFEVDLWDEGSGEVLGRPLRGFFDLVLENRKVIELKTSAKGWAESDLVRHLQMGAYAHVWNALHGGPSDIEVHVLVKLKREPRLETYRVERGEPGNRWWLQAASEIEAAIAAHHFPPSPSPLCHDCEYARACTAFTFPIREERTEEPPPRRLPLAPPAPMLHLGL